MHRIWNLAFERSILLGLLAAMTAITAIGVGGMAASVVVAERTQGSGSAINVAGSLRRLSHRMGSIVLADAANRVEERYTLRAAIIHFEQTLAHEALYTVLARHPDSAFAATYKGVRETWGQRLKPMLMEEAMPGPDLHDVSRHNELLELIDAFVDQLNTMVAQLEDDTEQRIRMLRAILGAALVLTLLLLVSGLYAVHRGILAPLADLLDNAARIARGDFTARARHVGRDELGRLGQAFNFMAEDLSKLYGDLEDRVARKTVELTRSNQSLALLYNAIANLHHAPMAPETYRAMLGDLDGLLNLRGSMVCLLTHQGGRARVLAATFAPCHEREADGCVHCAERPAPDRLWEYRDEADCRLLTVPLRDMEGLYGVMRLVLERGRRLDDWQEQLLQALARHVGIALGIAHKTEQERLLALQEERSIIARELHDSIAQSLSYMKIQASLLHPLLSDPARRAEAEATLRDLREGISAAYRQLRELLATFRLKMQGSFLTLLSGAVSEYAARGDLPIHLRTELGGCHLTPNQEIHTLQVVREALSNVLRHAQARTAWVDVTCVEDTEVVATVADDGTGFIAAQTGDAFHYGLTIMRERALGLRGTLDITSRPQGGTLVTLRFSTVPTAPAPAMDALT